MRASEKLVVDALPRVGGNNSPGRKEKRIRVLHSEKYVHTIVRTGYLSNASTKSCLFERAEGHPTKKKKVLVGKGYGAENENMLHES